MAEQTVCRHNLLKIGIGSGFHPRQRWRRIFGGQESRVDTAPGKVSAGPDMTKPLSLGLGFLLLWGIGSARAQTALGKHPADKLLPAFLRQNTNASTLALGLSNSTVAVQLPAAGLNLGGTTRTNWPEGGSGDALPTAWTNSPRIANSLYLDTAKMTATEAGKFVAEAGFQGDGSSILGLRAPALSGTLAVGAVSNAAGSRVAYVSDVGGGGATNWDYQSITNPPWFNSNSPLVVNMTNVGYATQAGYADYGRLVMGTNTSGGAVGATMLVAKLLSDTARRRFSFRVLALPGAWRRRPGDRGEPAGYFAGPGAVWQLAVGHFGESDE